jgi:hypothetical protein
MKAVVEHWMPENLQELCAAVQEMSRLCREAGHDPETVYVETHGFSLIQSVLTDNSTVLDIKVLAHSVDPRR